MPPDDYSGQNLRGHSFRNQNLEGANFSYADIRSADFTGAKLRSANFSHAKAGLQKRWAAFLMLVSWLIAGFAGFSSAIVALSIVYVFNIENSSNQLAGWIALILIIVVVIVVFVVFIVIIRQALNSAVTGVFAFAFVFAFPVVVTGVFLVVFILISNFLFVFAFAFAFALAVAVAVAFIVAGAFAFALAVAVAVAFAFAFAVAVAGASALAGTSALAGIKAIASAIAIAIAFVLLNIYISWRSLKGDEKYALIRKIAVAFAAVGGTSFSNSDLSDANFTGATLKNTDFRKANLTRTCFHKTKKLDLARPGETYLQKAQIPGVLVTGQGQDKIFDRQDLRGVNFKGANLVDASFIGANISEANLQDANLSRAKLVQAQLDSTDFTGATLTGAYIKDWGITSDTKFDGVRCEYVYMYLPTKENPDPLRKPDNREEVFADGEFGDFIKPIFDTLDLYHNQGVDPRAIAISFKQLAENHPEAELEIVAMEKRGRDKFLLRAKTAPNVDKSELSAKYFDTYNQLKSLPEREIKLLLAEKDSRIRSLENFVTLALQNPSFYSSTQVEKVENMNSNQGGIHQSVSNSQLEGGLQAVEGNQNQQDMKEE